MDISRAQDSGNRVSNSVRGERRDPSVVVNENGDDTSGSTAIASSCSRNSTGPGTLSSSSPPLNQTECSPPDGTTDTNLDDRIRFALNELDLHESNHRTTGITQPSTQNDSESADSDNSDSENETYPNEMGYMPLPQEPDLDMDCDGSEEGVCCVPQATGSDGRSCDHRDRTSCDASGCGGVCEQKLSNAAEGIQKNTQDSKGASTKSASNLKDGTKNLLKQLVIKRGLLFCLCSLYIDEVESIKKAMSGFSLPTSAVPEWAKHIPEDIWKSELIDGLQGKLKQEKKS